MAKNVSPVTKPTAWISTSVTKARSLICPATDATVFSLVPFVRPIISFTTAAADWQTPSTHSATRTSDALPVTKYTPAKKSRKGIAAATPNALAANGISISTPINVTCNLSKRKRKNEPKRKNEAPPRSWPPFRPMKEGPSTNGKSVTPCHRLSTLTSRPDKIKASMWRICYAPNGAIRINAKSLKVRRASKNFWIGCANKPRPTTLKKREKRDRCGA